MRLVIWVLLAVYSKTYYGVNESQYGWIPTTNAVMVVLFQIFGHPGDQTVPPLKVLAVGAFFYGIANLTVAFGAGLLVLLGQYGHHDDG